MQNCPTSLSIGTVQARAGRRSGVSRLLARGAVLVAAAAMFSSCSLFRPHHAAGPATALTAGSVTVQFSGVTAFTEDDLRDALADAVDSMNSEGLSPATADDAAFFLELYYRKSGYVFV